MATKTDETLFAEPWNGSDMVLLVEEKEIHVHKCILIMQSPVFKAMFDGHFKEAGQNKITLEEKNFQSMVQFLKALYPPSMIETAKSPLNDSTRLSIMALAEEYQCVNLIKQYMNDFEITPHIATQLFPYAVKYDQSVLTKLNDVLNWGASTARLENEVLPKLENKEPFIKTILTKCRFLENSVVEMQSTLVSLISGFLEKKTKLAEAELALQNMNGQGKKVIMHNPHSSLIFSGLKSTNTSSLNLTTEANSRCPHRVHITNISQTKGCVHCKENYKEKFLVGVPNSGHDLFNMLQRGDDIATAVNGVKPVKYVQKTTFNSVW